MVYADIVLPLAQPAYTFAVAEGMEVTPGQAVAVPFGGNKIYTGIVCRVHAQAPTAKRIRTIAKILYSHPLLSEIQLRLWTWIAEYYLCTPGEVMRAALPALMKPSGATEEEFAEEEFRPRTESYLSLAEELRNDAHLHNIFEKLTKRAPHQYETLLAIAAAEPAEVPRRLLQAESSVLRALESKGFIRRTEHERSCEPPQAVPFLLPELTAHQQEALKALKMGFRSHPTGLLQGITGSGKTEIYIHLIAQTLAAGDDVLLLVPEIALTTQLIERMERIFGSRVTPYHSKLSAHKRTEAFLRLSRSNGGEFVVGARSALFLPLKRLKLVVVDEEHDASYKQDDPSPRYNARDCAVMLARLTEGHTLLGSATPSLETWLNAQGGKYAYATLNERYGGSKPPQILVSDTIRAAKRGERRSHFNKLLLDKIGETLDAKRQVMLFQNRRGFSPYVECGECGWTSRCPHCNVTLTLHKNADRLICHYCGHSEPVPTRCPSCKVTDVVPKGFGTEKIEEEIQKMFPEARVARLDRDSVTSERAFSGIVTAFKRGETDILVGTQMISKGFDFGGVGLVGILNADNLLLNPDFRAAERAFQLMTQVAGRAGRRELPGEVVIQTSEPGHPVIAQVVAGDYDEMARAQLAERQAFFYPPYARLTHLLLKHRDPAILRQGATELAASLRKIFGRRVLGPIAPPVDRIRGEYLAGILLKVENGTSATKAREILLRELGVFRRTPVFKSITINCNVDPQ